MKRLKLLSVLVLICFLTGSLQQIIVEGGEGYRFGYNIQEMELFLGKKADAHLLLDLKPQVLDSVVPNGVNLKNGDELIILPYKATITTFSAFDNETPQTDKTLRIINTILNFVVVGVYIYFLILFFKIFLTFTRSKVFEEVNIRRLNIIGIGFICVGLLNILLNYIRISIAIHAIELEDYYITYANVIEWGNIVIGSIILMMTEILRIAVSLKREQELTI